MSYWIDIAGPQMIIFKGIFDFDELYKVMYDWFDYRGYTFHETKYKSKAKDTGLEREIIWDAWKKTTDFIKYWFRIHILMANVEKIEVVKENQKKELIKARMFIRVSAKLEVDYDDRFEGSKLKQSLRQFLITYVIKRKIDSSWGDILQFKQYEVLNIIKQTLDMQIKGNELADVW